jgi:hypothetical protein
MTKPRYRIYGRKQVEVNTDPQRRCYNGCHFSSEWIWTDWYNLGSTNTQEEAEDSVASWKRTNPKRHEYKFNLETSEFPELDSYYKSAEFVKLGEASSLKVTLREQMRRSGSRSIVVDTTKADAKIVSVAKRNNQTGDE